MAIPKRVRERVVENLQDLSSKQVKEVLNFMEFLRIKENQEFIEYVNQRTKSAIEAKKKGQHFSTLEELQREYK